MKKILLVFLLLSFISFGQDLTKWQNYFSFNQVNEVVGTSDDFWAATEGGAFHYTAADDQYKTLSIVEGLGSNNITTIAKDKNGKIWFGSNNGMINILDPATNRIDKILDIVNSDKTQKGINQIVIKGNDAYIVTDFGISLIDIDTYNFGDTFRKFGSFNVEIKTYSIFIDGDKLYVSTEEGLAVLKDGSTNPVAPESWESYSVDDRPVYKSVLFNSEIISCTDNGLYKFNGSDWTQFSLSGSTINDIKSSSNSLFILTPNKVYKYNTSLSEVNLNFNSSSTFRNFIVEDESSFLISSDSGVVQIGNNNKVLMPNGPLKNRILHIDIDENSNLFAATGIDGTGSGVFHLDKTIWKNYNKSNTPGLVFNDIQKIYCAPDGKTYLMSKGNGFSIFENGEFSQFTSSNTQMEGIPANANFVVVSDIEYDVNENAWISLLLAHSKRNIAVKRKAGDWYYFQLPNSLAPDAIHTYDIEVDRYKTKWFIAEGKLCYFNNNNNYTNTSDDVWGKFTNINGTVQTIETDERGDLWVGTNRGLYILSQTNNLASATVKEVIVEAVYRRSINVIEVDALNQKWVVSDAGLVHLSHDGTRAFEAFTTENSPLPSNNISSLSFEYKTGILYIATKEGLLSYQTTAQEPNKEFGDLFVYPSPFVVKSGLDNLVNIDGLIKDTQIKILSISGELIREFETPGGRIATWDGKDENGNFVGSGVYIVVAYDREANNVATTKIAVLRK